MLPYFFVLVAIAARFGIAANHSSFHFTPVAASLLSSNVTPMRVVGASLAASVSFFAVSNFSVWAIWNMYPKTLAGLAECYAMAVPFFRNTVASDLLFAGAFFGVAALLPQLSRKVSQPIA